MAVPDYQSVMLPLLEYAANRNGELSTGEAADALAVSLGLSEEDLKQMLPSGISPTFINRVGWAATYMKKAGLLEATRRGRPRVHADREMRQPYRRLFGIGEVRGRSKENK